jgi:hypothetical protein
VTTGSASTGAAGTTSTAGASTSAASATGTSAGSATGTAGSATSTAGSSTSTASARTVAIEARDFAFGAPDTFEGGWVTLQLKNTGKEPHHAQLAKLKDNVTVQSFMTELQKGENAAMAVINLVGGPAVISPGGASEVSLNLAPGQYVMLCFIPSQDGVPHLAKGMIKPFQVTAGSAAGAAPTDKGTVVMKDFTFDVPATVASGRTTLKVSNDGPQPHETAVMKLAPGKTVQDLVAFFSGQPAGPPPFEAIGGMQGLDKGASGFMTLDLPAGEYAFICQIPDPQSGKPHLALGMAKGVSVK